MKQSKKLLLLGGSAQQIVAIETAKRLGYSTVLCDYLPDNPGRSRADRFYLVSTTDKEAVLEVAQQEQIDGIIAYASDPAAPTAAYVAEIMGLPTNPYRSVEILCNKDLFRNFLRENGMNAPKTGGYTDADAALAELERFSLPVIVKPVDSSGSKGVTVLHSWENVREALDFAFSYSRSGRVVLEEFIQKSHPYLIGGDIFVAEGKVILWGLMNCHRDPEANPLVPVGKSFPPELSERDLDAVKKTLQELVDKLQIRTGAMNVELVVDHSGRVWPIDVGPRNGGNMIPDLLGYIFDIDVVEMSVSAAMGEAKLPQIGTRPSCYATHNLHSVKNGIYEDILFSPELEKFTVRKCLYKRAGDAVEFFDNAAKALGIVFMKFENRAQMMDFLPEIGKHIEIKLR